jgi:hypothetical protein
MTYGCHNKPRPTKESGYIAQGGWREYKDQQGRPVKMPVHVEVKSAFGTTTCQYDKSATDSSCKGCQWGNHGQQNTSAS